MKGNFGFEPYLYAVNQTLMTSIGKFVFSSYALFIERERLVNVRKKKIIYLACSVIDDEFHCLIECLMYDNERRLLLPTIL